MTTVVLSFEGIKPVPTTASQAEAEHAATNDPASLPHLFEGCPTGTFQYYLDTDTFHWSDEMYKIHGYQRGDVVPTYSLGQAHILPALREEAAAFWTEITEVGGPLSAYLTLRDIKGTHHQVLVTGDQLADGDTVLGVWGVLIDLTHSIHLDSHKLANEAVAASAIKRGIIEQAKGILMGQTGISAESAFMLISKRSQDTNRKVNTIAQDIVDRASTTAETDPLTTDASVRAAWEILTTY